MNLNLNYFYKYTGKKITKYQHFFIRIKKLTYFCPSATDRCPVLKSWGTDSLVISFCINIKLFIDKVLRHKENGDMKHEINNFRIFCWFIQTERHKKTFKEKWEKEIIDLEQRGGQKVYYY